MRLLLLLNELTGSAEHVQMSSLRLTSVFLCKCIVVSYVYSSALFEQLV